MNNRELNARTFWIEQDLAPSILNILYRDCEQLRPGELIWWNTGLVTKLINVPTLI